MYISSINSTNNYSHKGKIKMCPDLKWAMKVSNYETLSRFNSLLDRADKVNDNKLYYLVKNRYWKSENNGFGGQFINLASVYVKNLATTFKSYGNFLDSCSLDNEGKISYKEVLPLFIKCLEEQYPLTGNKEEVINEIQNKVVK